MTTAPGTSVFRLFPVLRPFIASFLAFAGPALAQQQSLEMQAGAGGPVGNGPSVVSQAVTMRRNTDNPAGNTFVARTPAITVTYSLSAQQYTGLTTAQGFPAGTGGNAVIFGGNTNTVITQPGAPLYTGQNFFGGGLSSSFTSSGGAAAGTGFDTTANGGIVMFLSARALALQPIATRPATTARARMADLTLTFNQPVNNPILHVAGMGGFVLSPVVGGPTLGFTTEFDLVTGGLSLTQLSGNAVFSIAGSSVNNSAVTPSSSCVNVDEGACGSVRVNGTGITTLLLRVFLNGDGGATTWDAGNTTQHPGDGLSIGVSLNPIADLSIVKTNTPGVNGDADQANDAVAAGATTYRLTVSNAGPDPISGAVVTDAPGAGLNCPPANAVTITGSGVPAGSFTVANLTSTGIPLGTLTAGQAALLSFNCTVL